MSIYDVAPVEAFHPELGLLLATWADSTREWRRNLGEPSDEALVWQPYREGPSIGGLMLHMAACERYWLQDFAVGVKLDPNDPAIAYDAQVDQYVPHWATPPAHPLAWYFEVLDSTRAEMVALVSAERDPTRLMPRRDYHVSYRWILAHLVEHDSYHGGQAVLLHEMWKQQHQRG
jgi:uncharacterized damage-inducible protein DinB